MLRRCSPSLISASYISRHHTIRTLQPGFNTFRGMSTAAPVNILLVGLGSIGSVYAYILEKSGRARVTAVARSNYELYTNQGVTLKTDKFGEIKGWKPYKVVKSQAEALASGSHYDYCLLTTKCLPDVTPNTTLLGPAIESGKVDAWCLIQNGLGVERDLYEAVKASGTPVISSLAWIGVMAKENGSVVEWRGGDMLVSGLYPPEARPRPSSGGEATESSAPLESRKTTQKETDALELWRSLLDEGGANIKTTDHVDAVRYAKNIWNATWSSIQALSRTHPATFASLSAETVAPLKKLIREIVDVGFEAGLLRKGDPQWNLGGKEMGGREDIANGCWDIITSMAQSKIAAGQMPHKMSLWIDVEQDRPIEVEVIVGEVVRLAKQVGVDVPRLEVVEALMRGLQASILARREKSI